ncbi:MAG: hypothetical protein PHG25_04430, partial [Candidatus Pacebacteria bacterium]|nr:hypothetical protein [Candidatus Paceibacterota bacterium]
NSWSPIYGFANIVKNNAVHLGVVCNSGAVNAVSLENPIDYAKGAITWRNWLAMADTMRNHPEVQIAWAIPYDLLCDTSPTSWRYDSSRIAYYHFAFYLSVMDTNSWYGAMRWNDTTKWRDIFEIDPQAPGPKATIIDSVGTGGGAYAAKQYIIRRYFSSGATDTTWVFYRTPYGTGDDFVNDSVSVALGRSIYKIDVNADTSATAVSTIYLHPYQAWIGTNKGAPAADPAIGIYPASLTFTGSIGGSNPADQYITLSNSGAGVLNWTATKTAAWLTISPTSGSISGTVTPITVSASLTGLTAGTYTDNITIAAVGASNTPQTIAVTFTVSAMAPAVSHGKKLHGIRR